MGNETKGSEQAHAAIDAQQGCASYRLGISHHKLQRQTHHHLENQWMWRVVLSLDLSTPKVYAFVFSSGESWAHLPPFLSP